MCEQAVKYGEYKLNDYVIQNDDTMRVILGVGHFAIIDWDDYEMVNPYTWTIENKTKKYAINVLKKIRMHRLIMSCPKGMTVDHINGNGLDNRRSNLRICTLSQNKPYFRHNDFHLR